MSQICFYKETGEKPAAVICLCRECTGQPQDCRYIPTEYLPKFLTIQVGDKPEPKPNKLEKTLG